MKKLSLILLCAFLPLALTSCRVNLIGGTAEVPWYVIAIALVLAFVLVYMRLLSQTYICPHCKEEFKAKWYQFSVSIHYMDKRMLKCPKCNKRSFCNIKRK